ncbi:MAG: glycosyltransferase family 2 protein [Gammaproteobacteria bacterium]
MPITIVTPSFNQGKFIERTIQSVLSQSIPKLEYVVVDGGSQDETLSILKKYSSQLRFVSEPDRGQAHAVNKGIMMTSGDLIGWLNSDDVYSPETLPTIMQFFADHPDIDVVYGKAQHIDHNDQVIEFYPTQEWNFKALKNRCYISQPAVFFRRRVIEKSGLLNENLHFCLDYEYWLRLAQGGARFAYLPQVLAGSRLYPETKTLSAPQKAQQEALTMLSQRLGYVPEDWLLNDAISYVQSKTQLRTPNRRYIAAIFIASIRSAFRWNGPLKGFRSCFLIPKAMLKRNAAKNK